jgi:hypothetical protein
MSAGDGTESRRLEIEARLDRRSAEALLLEIRVLGQQFGIEISAARVEMRRRDGGGEAGSA